MSEDKALEKSLATQTAIMRLDGQTITHISKKLKLKRRDVEKLTMTKEYKNALDTIDKDGLGYAKKLIQHRVSSMADQLANALERRVREGSDKSLEMALKILGLLRESNKVVVLGKK